MNKLFCASAQAATARRRQGNPGLTPDFRRRSGQPVNKAVWVLLATAALLILGAASAPAFSQSSGGQFEQLKSTIDGGGGRSAGGQFSITGTLGQPDATPAMTGGTYAVKGGFWTGPTTAPPSADLIFSDSFE